MTDPAAARPTGGRRGRRRLLVVALALYAAIALVVGIPAVWPLVSPVRMLVIGHSGDVAHWPRNSMASILSAIASGADGVEFDVAPSADGTWWLNHDADLAPTTTGSGAPWDNTDAQLATIRIDAGMGVDPMAQGGLQPLPRLDEVLDRLTGFRGIVIVDCKDERPGAHGALARLLAARGLYPSIIARNQAGAAEIKAVDGRFRVITQQLDTIDPNVDVWLADAGYELTPARTTVADMFGELGMFVGDSHWREDERPMLEMGRRLGVSFVITNDIAAALAWRDGTAP